MKIEYLTTEEFFEMMGLKTIKTEPRDAKREIKYFNFGKGDALIDFNETEYVPICNDPIADGKVN